MLQKFIKLQKGKILSLFATKMYGAKQIAGLIYPSYDIFQDKYIQENKLKIPV